MAISPFKAYQQLERTIRQLTDMVETFSPRLQSIEQQLLAQQREMRVMYHALALPENQHWVNQPPLVQGQPGNAIFSACSPCRQSSFEEAYFSYWTRELRESLRYHRKLWEFVFICQALHERGLLATGRRGLGFGVGEEPLSAYFASKGCQITASDIDLAYAIEMGWTDTNQHAVGKEALRHPHLCPNDIFDANVEFETSDMNNIPDHFQGYDFCWSACALEHLGSIEHGLAFIERSIDTLKPGGFAIHTTEFNTSSNHETLDHAGTVLFRRSDFAELSDRLSAKGHIMAPLDFNLGLKPVDRYVDMPPYREQPHLQLALEGFSATSYGLIIQRGPA